MLAEKRLEKSFERVIYMLSEAQLPQGGRNIG